MVPLSLIGGDISFYLLTKGQQFNQNDAGQPVPNSKEYQLSAMAAYVSSNDLVAATLEPISGAWSYQLKPGPGNLATLNRTDATLSAFDTDFPDGDYELIFNTVHDGTTTNILQLRPGTAADPYPVSPPHISNFAAVQSFDPSHALTLQWDPFTGAGANDFILVSFVDVAGYLFQSPYPGQPGVLPGTATSLTIAPGTFPATTTLGCVIFFCKTVFEDSSSYPGALGVAGYAARTVAVVVSGAASKPATTLQLQALPRTAAGQFQLQLSGQPGQQYVIEATAALPATAWSPLVTNSAATGTFNFVDPQSPGSPRRFYRARTAQ